MLIIIVAGLFLMAVAYLFLGPAPFLMPVLGSLYGSWLIWASLSVAGMAAGMAFVPLLPAMLNHLSEVGHARPCDAPCVHKREVAKLNLSS